MAVDGNNGFLTSGEKADAASRSVKVAERKAAVPQGPNNSIEYHLALGGRRRRPNMGMPVEAHARVGCLLKAVLTATKGRSGVYKRIDSVRSELDDWVQCEHDRKAMPDVVFFDLYYHENYHENAAGRDRHIDLRLVTTILSAHYRDCTPFRSVMKKIEAATRSLELVQ